ncbi:hypothetical protein M407DRAFT_34428 [Tulasnella calospora MUT 4182]|uniref:Uncharacterized protein n=1 Tax=Tulasnella calospora MUT 4182 TaxID=1051891 RepID=A0A0C3L2J2_9AGAM|nr:hypothetical protein M407DRAFT_34428 [Tulasnella calospora MUT 4182]
MSPNSFFQEILGSFESQVPPPQDQWGMSGMAESEPVLNIPADRSTTESFVVNFFPVHPSRLQRLTPMAEQAEPSHQISGSLLDMIPTGSVPIALPHP